MGALQAHVVELKALAKTNLVLAVRPKAAGENFHDVSTVMARLDFGDDLRVAENVALEAPRVCCEPSLGVPPEKNLCFRAVVELAKALGRAPSVAVHLQKRVPAQAGLGGGSSDAAAVLRALCKLWDLDETNPVVFRVARSLGADVPFFLGPPTALLVGRGDVLKKALPVPPGAVCLVRPYGPGVSTVAAYERFDALSKRSSRSRVSAEPRWDPRVGQMLDALEDASASRVARAFANDLERASVDLNSSLGDALLWLRSTPGVLAAQVCGSGSASFALCTTLEAAQAVARAARDAGFWSHACCWSRV